GRFSCDRLGSKLNMITIKNHVNSKIENIMVNWDDFERNSKEEFINIGIQHRVLSEHQYQISHGTVIEISNLRDSWNRDKILKLKKSLEKLINPNQQDQKFNIEIIAKEELTNDKNANSEIEKVNGYVRNTIFEVLKIKTTKIITEITEDGRFITSTLIDRGKLIYKIKEKNPYNLHDITIELFYLNRSAKVNFTRIMGVEPVNYG
ncbi:ATP-binding protein, partial [Butyricicoccus sp. 1XD8-22]